MAERGRPSKYKPEYCKRIIELMREGCSMVEVAADLDVHKDTLYEWESVHADFSDALKRGRGLSEAWWEKEGRTSLRDNDFNSGLWFMNMKNRHGWRDKIETDNKHEVTLSIAEQIRQAHAKLNESDERTGADSTDRR